MLALFTSQSFLCNSILSMSDSQFNNHFILGIENDASAGEAKAAYRRLAKRFHPDGPEGDAERFYAITEAHAAICANPDAAMPTKRRNLVSGFWKAARSKPSTSHVKPVNGNDIHAVLYLTLEDALKGAHRRVTLPSGKALDVNCPPGCSSDDTIRLAGAGQSGRFGGKSGDALIRIELLQHSRATLKGRDVHLPLWMDLAQLRNGARVEVATPHGPLKVRIPPLSSHGQSLRLKGMGLPAYKNQTVGHLFFTLKARRAAGFAVALGRFSRIWSNPMRSQAQTKA